MLKQVTTLVHCYVVQTVKTLAVDKYWLSLVLSHHILTSNQKYMYCLKKKVDVIHRFSKTIVHSSTSVRLMLQVLSNYQKVRSEEHTSELQSRFDLVCRPLLEKKK